MKGEKDCIECKAGTFCHAGAVDAIPCAPGTFSEAPGKSSCTPCIAGKYQAGTSASSCQECEAGTFCPRHSSAQLLCPAGTYSDATGLTADTDCTPCPAGHACVAGAIEPTQCAAGSYAPAVGAGWCEPCPAGSFQDSTGASACVACRAGSLCPLGASLELPAACDPGWYADLTDKDGSPDCSECPEGFYCPGGAAQPTPCFPGSFSATDGSSACAPCPAGSYQPHVQGTVCWTCEVGQYCTEGASTPQPCPAGTHSDPSLDVMKGVEDCIECTAGTFCPTGSTTETECAPGSFGASSGSDVCVLCETGTYSSAGSTSCTSCGEGTYADNQGQSECTPCAHPLSSGSGSTECSVCLAGFYLHFSSATPPEMRDKPDNFCRLCPLHAQCPYNTTLETLLVPPGFWRDSRTTTRLYECRRDSTGASACRGSGSARRAELAAEDNPYCAEGYRGPRCSVCTDPGKHFSRDNVCENCPPASRLTILVGVCLGVTAVVALCALFGTTGRFARRTVLVISSLSLQAKFKIVVSFFQVFNVLGVVYGVRLHPDFDGWLEILAIFNFDALEYVYPGSCIGSMRDRLTFSGLWPFAAIFVVVLAICAYGMVHKLLSSTASLAKEVLFPCIYATIFVAYLVLPSVSRSIFSAQLCESFHSDDFSGTSSSYLVADPDVSCSNDDPEYRTLATYFWVFFALWPVVVPMAFLGLVLWIRPSVQAQHVTELAEACRFLWRDYDARLLYWEVFDMIRKLALSAWILFVDTEHGSERMLRLVLAAIVSAAHLAMLALAQPYKRSDDLYLACTASLLLIACFSASSAIKLCEDGQWEDTCNSLVGLTDGYNTTLVVVIMTMIMLGVSVIVVVGQSVAAFTRPTIRLVSTGQEPELELPPSSAFHCLISHAWSTGQDQTHTVVRQLQVLVPDIRVWLDVDNLEDVGKLEEAVGSSAVFLIFLSSGYFASANCRRELYAALGAGKPIVALQELDKAKGGATLEELQEECRQYCDEEVASYPQYRGPAEVLDRVFSEEPVVWVRVHDFQLVSLKAATLRILAHLPSYERSPEELAMGLRVPGELGPFGFAAATTLLVCKANAGAREVAEELREAAQEGVGGASVWVAGAEKVLHGGEAGEPESRSATVLLLYLNSDIDLAPSSPITSLVKRAIDGKIRVALVHEQSEKHGACPFGRFLDSTARELILAPYNLFNTVAVPLYAMPEHRIISLRYVLRSMGARPLPSKDPGGEAAKRPQEPRPPRAFPSRAAAAWTGSTRTGRGGEGGGAAASKAVHSTLPRQPRRRERTPPRPVDPAATTPESTSDEEAVQNLTLHGTAGRQPRALPAFSLSQELNSLGVEHGERKLRFT